MIWSSIVHTHFLKFLSLWSETAACLPEPPSPGRKEALRAEGKRNAGPMCELIIQERAKKSQGNLCKLLNFVKSTQKVHICAGASVGMAGNKIPPLRAEGPQRGKRIQKLGKISRPRPTGSCAWRACRSTRRCRTPSPEQRACSGRTRRRSPSSSARRPHRRTTWYGQSRPRSG